MERFQVVTSKLRDNSLPEWMHNAVVDFWTGQVFIPILDKAGWLHATAYGQIIFFNGKPFGSANGFIDRFPDKRGVLTATVEKIRRAAAAA